MAKKRIVTFLGPGEGLSVSGDFAYAYSGVLKPGSGPTTVLDFTTGNYLCVGRFEMNADFSGAGSYNYNVTIKLNGNKIVFENDNGVYHKQTIVFHVIIPPNTVVEGLLGDGGSNKDMNLNFTGKIYG